MPQNICVSPRYKAATTAGDCAVTHLPVSLLVLQ